MNSPLGIIISREYLERVKRKSFIITTLLVPILMIGLMVAPALFMLMSEPESSHVAVLDHTGRIAQRLHGNGEIRFVAADAELDSLRSDAANDIILVFGDAAIERPQTDVTVYSRGALSLMTDEYITREINRAIEDVRLEAYNMGNIRQIMREVEVDCTYPAIRIDRQEESTSSSAVSYFIALMMDMMLYMFILIYGQMVMNSIIEEKNNRVLELVVSSVKPKSLMLGKILRVGAGAITTRLIWAGLLVV
ncbi:MAG: ABC transporter permease, partial [Muribaculaceae bacterium]|nr:ABC transporter permease [Muribaculaceae bacterium]